MAVGTPSIGIDPRTMKEVTDTLQGIEKKIPKTIIRAIGRTTRWLRSQMVKTGAKALGTKQKTIRGRVWRNQAKRRFFGKVRAGAVGWPLEDIYKLKVKRARKGSRKRPVLMARVNRKWVVVDDAFMAKMPTGHEGAFLRKGRRRLPVKTARSESLTSILERKGLTQELVASARAKFITELLDAADYYALTEGTTAREAAPALAAARAARAAQRGET